MANADPDWDNLTKNSNITEDIYRINRIFSRAHHRRRNGQSHWIPMGHANCGYCERGVLSVVDIPHIGTKKVVGEDRRKKGLRHVSKIYRILRKISRFRRRSLTVNKIRLVTIIN